MRGVILAAFCVVAGPAAAEFEAVHIQSPTGNIHCMILQNDGEGGVLCEVRNLTPSFTKRPADCELEWGSSFYVPAKGRAELACHGDTIQSPGSLVLDYGKSISLFGISCLSSRTGMRCSNAEGRGFEVARAAQKLF